MRRHGFLAEQKRVAHKAPVRISSTQRRAATSEAIAHVTGLANALTLQFRLLDRIGDNGLVSTMILRPNGEHDDVLEIQNWVMNCRVFGRQLEIEAMNIAVETAQRRGISSSTSTPYDGRT